MSLLLCGNKYKFSRTLPQKTFQIRWFKEKGGCHAGASTLVKASAIPGAASWATSPEEGGRASVATLTPMPFPLSPQAHLGQECAFWKQSKGKATSGAMCARAHPAWLPRLLPSNTCPHRDLRGGLEACSPLAPVSPASHAVTRTSLCTWVVELNSLRGVSSCSARSQVGKAGLVHLQGAGAQLLSYGSKA